VLIVLGVSFVYATIGVLPDQVGTHYGVNNQADGWMKRDAYLRYMMEFLILVPAGLAAAIALLPRLFPAYASIPNRAHWMAEERRERSLRYLERQGAWFGCLQVIMVAAMHALILHAHRSQPPVLSTALVVPLLISFLVAALLWVLAIYRRFAKPKLPSAGSLSEHPPAPPR
jgi:uncharacterized membrane protein